MKKCVICGTEHNINSDYCSKACRDKAYRLRKKAETIAARFVETETVPVKEKKETKAVVKPAKDETPKVEKLKSEKAAEAEKIKPKKTPATVVIHTFDHPIRLFWNHRFEEKNSSCAKAGTELSFETISEGVYRVRRGKRNFFTNDEELAKSGVEKL